MASATLYPPIVDTYTDAFIASEDASCRIYYSLSKFSNDEIESIHISVTKQSSGENVINKNEENIEKGRFRASGILIIEEEQLLKKASEYENLYYIDIKNEDIKDGWQKGWIYKVQIRFSKKKYSNNDNNLNQADWLNSSNNAENFSEWSTYTIVKAIGKPIIKIPVLNGYDSEVDSKNDNIFKVYTLSTTTLEFTGSYENKDDKSEVLYNYRLQLFNNDKLIESSDLIYSNQYAPNQFYYLFNTELKSGDSYVLKLEYETLNKYYEIKTFNIDVYELISETTEIEILVAEDLEKEEYKKDFVNLFTSVEEEQDDGRIALKLFSKNKNPLFTNICIRRSDSKTNFQIWNDIKIFNLKNNAIDELPVFYDYTIESGVWYKYGVQIINTNNIRSILKEHEPIKREFYYSYLLGENSQQLKLTFNENINSFKNTYSESKFDTIGGKYPFITRNGNMKYKTFPINGMISFNMDVKNLFIDKKKIYQYDEIVDLYGKENLGMYDYTYERDFRTKVLEFLEDGKPKLFKSPTEGNILVRLMDINTSPEQSLGRLISSFSCNAYEIDEASMENYLKYNFYEIGTIEKDLFITEKKIGQISMKVPVGSNLFKLISDKYSNKALAEKEKIVSQIYSLSITFNGEPELVNDNAGGVKYGFNFNLNGNRFTVDAAYTNIYQFDNEVIFTPENKLLLGVDNGSDEINNNKMIDITANFLYNVSIKPIKEKQILYKQIIKNIGQIYKSFNVNDSIYREIYYKHKYDWDEYFRVLSEMRCINIEANPGTIIALIDSDDNESEQHIIGPTGVLNLTDIGPIKDLIYKGIQDSKTGKNIVEENNINIPSDILVDYVYYLTEGKYFKEGD